MYPLSKKPKTVINQNSKFQTTRVKSEELNEIVDFEIDSLGAPEEWLTGYHTNLVNRQELYVFLQMVDQWQLANSVVMSNTKQTLPTWDSSLMHQCEEGELVHKL